MAKREMRVWAVVKGKPKHYKGETNLERTVREWRPGDPSKGKPGRGHNTRNQERRSGVSDPIAASSLDPTRHGRVRVSS
jgi:hypothetical protein